MTRAPFSTVAFFLAVVLELIVAPATRAGLEDPVGADGTVVEGVLPDELPACALALVTRASVVVNRSASFLNIGGVFVGGGESGDALEAELLPVEAVVGILLEIDVVARGAAGDVPGHAGGRSRT